MYWWQTPFSSSSSSSSSNHHHSYDSGGLNKIFSLRGRAFRSQQRRLTRARKLRHLNDGDVQDSRSLRRSPSSHDQSSARSSPVVPQPLPLPELAVLLGRNAGSSHNSSLIQGNIPLPSPKEPTSRGEERERADGLTPDANGDRVTPSSAFGSTFTGHDSRKNKDHSDTRRSRKAPRELNVVEGFQDNYGINIPISAPTSPLSSPALSPQRSGDIFKSHYMSPQVFQVWSAPEMPPLDMNLGLGFSYQMSSEKIAFSVDSSPLHSPRVSPRRNNRSPSGPTSPLHKKFSIETPSAWHDSTAQANVHPLPLPPGATSPLQPTSIHQVTAKPELIPKNSQWKKGKLIWRGTFGSVYVASNRETGALCAMKEVELLFDDPKIWAFYPF